MYVHIHSDVYYVCNMHLYTHISLQIYFCTWHTYLCIPGKVSGLLGYKLVT